MLHALVIADHVYTDRDSGKKIIAGVFQGITVRPRKRVEGETPTEAGQRALESQLGAAGSPWAYIALTEVVGQTELELRWVRLKSEEVFWAAKVKIPGDDDPLRIHEIVSALPPLYFGKDGPHALELLHENTPLGGLRMQIVTEAPKQ